ncbi:MAG: sugar kinase [Ilumatobacter sp.]|nr:MAG: sugar kinase [Ilumatobacter sp.]
MNGVLATRPSNECRFDVVSLGEVMVRFDPGEGRVRTARTFQVSEGGGEYNVGRSLRRVFGHRVATVTALGDNEVGRLLEDLLLQGGTHLDHVVWKTTDDVGREHRTPLNFTERGFGARAPRGVYDRAHSATASMSPDDVDWEHLFGNLGVRWLHTGGIFAGLSTSTFRTAQVAIETARRHGTVVSYDVNYRPSLWRASGGPEAHRQLTTDLVDHVDVLFGIDPDAFDDEVEHFRTASSSLAVVASTRRTVTSASVQDWTGTAWSTDTGRLDGAMHRQLQVLDRVGSGDGFAAGVIHGLLTGRTLAESLDLGIAHGALVMTTPGDTSSVSADDVDQLATGGAAGVVR